jgi:hypothetical protein
VPGASTAASPALPARHSNATLPPDRAPMADWVKSVTGEWAGCYFPPRLVASHCLSVAARGRPAPLERVGLLACEDGGAIVQADWLSMSSPGVTGSAGRISDPAGGVRVGRRRAAGGAFQIRPQADRRTAAETTSGGVDYLASKDWRGRIRNRRQDAARATHLPGHPELPEARPMRRRVPRSCRWHRRCHKGRSR